MAEFEEPVGFDRSEFAETMGDIARYHMPFGKYGPKHYPPKGVPIYDLPQEYLHWFLTHGGGFPKGRLGELLELIYHLKTDGSDEVFDPMRRIAGGRTKLRPGRVREYRIKD